MKRLIWLLCGLPLAAQGGDWVEVAAPVEGDAHYYHAGKIHISGDEITYWRKVVFKSARKIRDGAAKSALFRERLHCAEHTLKTLDYLLYAENGALLGQTNRSDAEADPVIPDTLGDLFEKTMCPLIERHKAEERAKEAAPEILP